MNPVERDPEIEELRDRFAAAAAQGLAAHPTVDALNLARMAYDIADAMLRERARRLSGAAPATPARPGVPPRPR